MEILIVILLSLMLFGGAYISWFFLKVSKREREMDMVTFIRHYKEREVEEMEERYYKNKWVEEMEERSKGIRVIEENRPGDIQVIRDIGGDRIGVSKNSRMEENILIPEGLSEDEKQLLREFYDI